MNSTVNNSNVDIPMIQRRTVGIVGTGNVGAAYEIIDRKGHTDTAIGVVIARLVRTILSDQKSVLPISTQPDGAYDLGDVCLSTPCVVGIEGVEDHVTPNLSDDEYDALHASAQTLIDSREGLQIKP